MAIPISISPVMGEDESLYPIALLIDELKHDDGQVRLNAMKKIQTIGKALGPNRTREELVPFLNDSLEDEDELLLVMAEELGKFESLVGGEEYLHILLVPLEALATVDESTVRKKAADSIREIVGSMSTEHVSEYFFPLLKRLSTRDWYTSRISACSLYDVAHTKFTLVLQTEVVEMFNVLCKDTTPLVRRSASAALGPLAKCMNNQMVEKELLPLYTAFAEDKQDSVRSQSVMNSIALCSKASQETIKSTIMPIVSQAALDRSWRVRWSVANQFSEICRAVGKENAQTSFCHTFDKLLQDSEAEVRSTAACNVAKVCQHLDEHVIIEKIVPTFQILATDTSDHVRAAFASVVMNMSPILGREKAIVHLLPLLLQVGYRA